jgi:AcrR family transcriptional regulator
MIRNPSVSINLAMKPAAVSQRQSTPMMLGPSPDDVMRRRILDAAMSQFALVGIRRSSIDDIAHRAQVGRATVFRRFASKDGLVQALVLREARELIAGADTAVASLDALEDKLVEGFLICFNAARRHPVLTRLLEVEPETILPLLTTNGGPALALGRAVVARQLAEAGVAGDTAEPAELMTRIGLSLLLTRTPTFPLRSDQEIRQFARRYLVPMASAGA